MVWIDQVYGSDTTEVSFGNNSAVIRDGEYRATQTASLPNERITVTIGYNRTNLPAFNRTYRQICNSLRIE